MQRPLPTFIAPGAPVSAIIYEPTHPNQSKPHFTHLQHDTEKYI
jgi:hypothetical protein